MMRLAPRLTVGVATAIAVTALVRTSAAQTAPAQTAPAAAATWAFSTTSDSAAESLIDLRGLNEKTAGEHGFLAVSPDGNSLALGDGRPVRLWGAAATISAKMSDADLALHAKFLARMGVNMVRVGGATAGLIPQQPGAKLTDVNEYFIQDVWRLVAAMKKEGVYVRISPLWDHGSVKYLGEDWGLEGYKSGDSINGLIFFEPHLQEGYKAWMKKLLTEKNPHTGIPLKDDPALGIVQIVSEDTLFFWWTDQIKGGPRKELEKRFAEFAKTKYGSLDKALAAWDEAKDKADALEEGRLGLKPMYELTKDGGGPRLADQVEFMARTERGFYESMRKYLKDELGIKQLITASNFGSADKARLDDVERWTWTAGDLVEMNQFFSTDHKGANAAWRIDPGDTYTPRSATRTGQIPALRKQVAGKPFVLSSTTWILPNEYAVEGPVLQAAYGSMNGLDGFLWFSTQGPAYADPVMAWTTVKGGHPLFKWTISHPGLIAQFPAAALIFRQGLVDPAATVVHEERSLDSLFQRAKPAAADGFDYKAAADGRAHLIGRVEVTYDAKDQQNITDLAPFIDAQTAGVRSTHGQLAINTTKGLVTINAPKAQGVVGFLKDAGGTFALKDVTIESANDFASVVVLSLDGKPLKESAKLLVQVGTPATPTGWQTKPAPKAGKDTVEIVATGQMPWQVQNTQVTLAITSPAIKEALLLDEQGRKVGTVPLERKGEQARIALPPKALYVILVGG
jgi:hypothetical protein